MDDYQRYIHASRYARYLPDKKRRETWEETVARYCDFFANKYPEFPKDELFNAIVKMEVMPSMRALMTAGKALERDNVAGYNPVTGDTRVVTKEFGTLPIAHLEGKSATVLNKDGRWTEAEFRGYGNQPIYKVTVKLNSNTIKEVTCTANHRWIKQDGNVVSTLHLKEGDRIDFVSAPKPEVDADYNLGIMHGLVYGDGTTAKSCGRVKGYVIRLCGEDNKELLKYFNGYPVTYPPSANGDPVVQMYDEFAATHALKELPSHEETDSYLLGFIRGWLAADGSVTKSSQVSLCVANEGLNWLSQNAERLGFTIQRTYKQAAETNYGKRKQGSWIVYFSRSSMVYDDFLCSWKRVNFKPLESHWVVKSVEDAGYEDSVYCAEVDDTNTFTLEGGLITGNCSYVPIDDPRAFDETLYILMCGTGVGFSVERQFISKLPVVAEDFHDTDSVIHVRDSKIGWATAFRELIALLYSGKVPKWNTDGVRPSGARLKTFGGRASGPEPLNELFQFSVKLFKRAAGRKLNSLECHDLVCKIADIVVAGGVRRSALISLSNLTDARMQGAKNGMWWEENPQRALANNSVAYTELPDMGIFMKEWGVLYESKSGERGVFNRVAATKKAAESGRRDAVQDFGTNPCGEIILRPYGLCNLSEVIVRATDTRADLERKVKLATVLGTFQSTLTNFRYLRKIWRTNAEEERLLGVSLTGIMDSGRLSKINEDTEKLLEDLKNVAIEENKKWAAILGIEPSVSITTVKPSGTVSQLVDSASGIHPRYSQFYVRTVRSDKKDPLSAFLREQGIMCEDDVNNPNNYVFSFPMKAPDGSVMRDDMTAIDQLEHYKMFQQKWCEHNPSITVYVRDHEWLEVAAWVYKNFDSIGGVSFLPHSDHVYRQAPYQEISEGEYTKLLSLQPVVEWEKFVEDEDNVTTYKEMACFAGVCEL